jgi:hypothetical protein
MAFTKAMSENKLDLLEILNKGSQIDQALNEAMKFDRPPHRHAGDHPRPRLRSSRTD